MRNITLLASLCLLFAACQTDYFGIGEEIVTEQPMLEEEMNNEPELIFSLLSDHRNYSSFDTFLIWLTDSTGAVIDSSYHNLRANSNFNIYRPESFTAEKANVNILRIGQNVFYQFFENIELPSTYNYVFSEIDDAYPYGDPAQLNPLHVIIEIPEEELYGGFGNPLFPESWYGRSLTATELEDENVADGNAFRLNSFTGMYEAGLDLLVQTTDEIVLYNSVTIGDYQEEQLFSTIVNYNAEEHGDTIRIDYTLFDEDTEAQIIDIYSSNHNDGLYPYGGDITLGNVFDHGAPKFLAVRSVLGIGIPSILSDGNVSISANSENKEGRVFRRTCYTTNKSDLSVADMTVERNTMSVNYTDMFDFEIGTPDFEYDHLLLFNFFNVNDIFFRQSIFLESHQSSFVFPALPEEFTSLIPFAWDESLFQNEKQPIVTFDQIDKLSGLNDYYNYVTLHTLQDHENYFTENCISTYSVRM